MLRALRTGVIGGAVILVAFAALYVEAEEKLDEKKKISTEFYDIKALMFQICDYPGRQHDMAEEEDMETMRLSEPSMEQGLQPETVISLLQAIEPDSWTDPHRIEYHSGHLIVVQTQETHEKIRTTLEHLFEVSKGRMVCVEAWFAIVNKTFLKDHSVNIGIITAEKFRDIRTLISGDAENLGILGTCKTICMNAQRVNVFMAREKAYVSGLEVEVDQSVAVACPQIRRWPQGISLDVRPLIGPKNELVFTNFLACLTPKVTFRPEKTQFAAGAASSEKSSKPITPGFMTIEAPEVDIIKFNTSVKIPNGGAVILSAAGVELKDVKKADSEVILILTTSVVE